MKLKEIAEMAGGKIVGDETLEVVGVRGVEDASSGHVTYLAGKQYLEALKQSKASAVLVEAVVDLDMTQIVVPNPALAFAKLLAFFHPQKRSKPGVDSRAVIGDNVRLGKNVTLSPFVCLGDNVVLGDNCVLYPGVFVGDDCVIGDDCLFYSNVTLYPETRVGNHVVLHSGAVIGADGFGYTLDEAGRHFKIPQIGTVKLEDHVEVGANSCIDRANLGVTLVREGTKIDNLVQIGHNCAIGPHSIIVSQAGIAGSCQLGSYVVIGGQVGIADHLKIGDKAMLMSQAGVARDVPDGAIEGGSPSLPRKEYGRLVALSHKLPEMAKRIKELEKRLDEIEK